MKFKILSYCLVFAVLLTNKSIYAQETITFSGKVIVAESEIPVELATVVLKEVHKWSVTNNNGEFTIENVQAGDYILYVSCLGYKTIEQKITLRSGIKNFQISMEVETQGLNEVTVIAEESRVNGTSSTIKKDALRHLQPSSFADILELLPGGVTVKNKMTSMQLISLREPLEANDYDYDYNTSFGTAFVIDGHTLSNDAELQNITDGNGSYIANRNTTGKGIDMRLISTDNIESVEIVRGIPSVKYGDLTSGLVNIKRSYKAKPFYARIKSDPGSKLFSVGKGIDLNDDSRLNMDLDFLDYKADARNPKVNYSRITGSIRFEYKKEAKNSITFHSNFDYTGSFDESKTDPEIDVQESVYDSKYNKIVFGSSLNISNNTSSWFKNLDVLVNASYTQNEKNLTEPVAGNRTPVYTNREEGEFYGTYLPGSYMGHLKLDGKPVYISSDISSYLVAKTFNLNHNILLGANWNYSKNFGDGEVYDETRPLYAGVGRPRASKDIPSMQKIAVYFEDKIVLPISLHTIIFKGGVRANRALNVNSAYKISDKFYFDPRINLNWKLPEINIWNQDVNLEFIGGYGMHSKFPGLSHLYPDVQYFDKVQLTYYSQNENLRQVHYKTKIVDPVNYELDPIRNEKFELGLNIRLGKIRAYLNAYREELKNGYKNLSRVAVMDYKLYDISSGPQPKDINEPPTVDMFEFEDKKDFMFYNQNINGAKETKQGFEYQIDFGQIKALKSRISLNGAWMKAKYDLSQPTYKRPQKYIDVGLYPYVGLYNWDLGKEYEQFNTNFRADTHIKEFGLIFSTSIQCMWYYKNKRNPHNGMPDSYMDKSGNFFKYDESDTTDPVLRFLYDEPSSNEFDTKRTPIGIDINLTVSKEIGEYMKLSFYVNSILDYHPSYTTEDGLHVRRISNPYFGMELNINL
ncbi:TonB-dependent receptor [Marinifilum caeruleilacunae]|uniref:TonB-dependent receptor n=1 Tax=Marinifilum caeruleilacunae TaxID=2499076 RepID=A0ABX1WQP7_9BACT|nr:carboxypeptidase-like regulatory domain-containing protein [Marinifilum caeruleilacunae]NOU58383.1 TonB-dependent receptor [Marinifilum caeruleilacunae]